MLDIKFIRENPEKVKQALKNRGVNLDVDKLLMLDEQRRAKIKEVDDLRAKQNEFSDAIAKAKDKEREEKIQASKRIKEGLAAEEGELKKIEEEYRLLMYQAPNIPLDDVPVGKNETENKVLRQWGEVPNFTFEPKDHVALGEALDIIDIERAAKIVGTRFNYLKGAAAFLEFALIQFTLSVLTSQKIIKKIARSVAKKFSERPFIPVVPPAMIRPEVFSRMGRLNEQDKDERYHLAQDNLYLVGSAEHTLGPMHMDETFQEDALPKRYVGFSTSFRREAGSYGKDTHGILRVHQFDKLEVESFTLPEDSITEQDFIIAIQEYMVRALEIPYQVVAICTGDMGAPDARQIDIEMWMPGQNQYRETHTSDLMTDYQARRLNTRVHRKDGKTEFVHMNDATAFAIGRTLIAILENYQQEDGSVKVPKALQKYMGGLKVIK